MTPSVCVCVVQAGDHIQAAESAQDSVPSTSYGSTASASSSRWDAKKLAVKVLQLQEFIIQEICKVRFSHCICAVCPVCMMSLGHHYLNTSQLRLGLGFHQTSPQQAQHNRQSMTGSCSLRIPSLLLSYLFFYSCLAVFWIVTDLAYLWTHRQMSKWPRGTGLRAGLYMSKPTTQVTFLHVCLLWQQLL